MTEIQTVNGLPPEAFARLARIEAVKDTLTQSQAYAIARISDIHKVIGMNPSTPNRLALDIEMKELQKSKDDGAVRLRDTQTLFANLQRWMQARAAILRPRPLVMLKPIDTKPKKGETLVNGIKRLREEIVGLKNEVRKTMIAPLPRETIKAVASAHVTNLAKQFTPKIAIETINGQRVLRTDFIPENFSSDGMRPIHVLAMLSWLLPNTVTKRLHETIDAMPLPDAPSLSDDDKEARLASLAADMFELERCEEHWVTLCHESGMSHVVRRADANPMIVLGVRYQAVKPLQLNGARKTNGAHPVHPMKKKSRERVRLDPLPSDQKTNDKRTATSN